ncbi:MAG: PQQ-binding-like beta-propeller repeat protein [Acidobacteria bacterium]|nr:PQQ-binding-like beta-propeller repeat protein [Acidobacteriota bacterium]
MTRQLYTPYSMHDGYIVAHGGSSWGPPSFSPRTGLVYMTAKDGTIALIVRPVGDSIEIGQGRGGMTSQVSSRRNQMPPELTISAYEPISGEQVWQARAPTVSPIGVSGNLVTAGDVLVQGTDTGGFYAFDARTGERLFEYMSERPVRSSPMTYQVDGRQFIVVVASNRILAFALPAP